MVKVGARRGLLGRAHLRLPWDPADHARVGHGRIATTFSRPVSVASSGQLADVADEDEVKVAGGDGSEAHVRSDCSGP